MLLVAKDDTLRHSVFYTCLKDNRDELYLHIYTKVYNESDPSILRPFCVFSGRKKLSVQTVKMAVSFLRNIAGGVYVTRKTLNMSKRVCLNRFIAHFVRDVDFGI